MPGSMRVGARSRIDRAVGKSPVASPRELCDRKCPAHRRRRKGWRRNHELVRPTFGHHDAVFLVVVRTPAKILELQFESAVTFGTDLQRLHTGFHDFRADSIAAHRGNLVSLHDRSPASGTSSVGRGNLSASWADTTSSAWFLD